MFKCNCPHEIRSGCSEPKCAHYIPPRPEKAVPVMKEQKYIVRQLGDDRCDVVHIGPYVVSKDLKLREALALAKALNEENKDR